MKSFEAKIFVGFKERDTGILHTLEECESLCQDFVNENPQCVSVTPTEYIYTNGREPGAIIGFIQYPRFPTDEEILKDLSLQLAKRLLLALGQYRVTVNFPDEVVMLSNPNL